MAQLRQLLEQHGYENVKTVLQSGNVVLDAAEPAHIEKIIKAGFGMDVRVMTRSHAELRKIVTDNPYKQHEDQPSKLAVAFLDKPVGNMDVDPELYLPDQFTVQGSEIYLWFPNGMADTKLMNNSFQKSIGAAATVRNWNTVTKMLALTG